MPQWRAARAVGGRWNAIPARAGPSDAPQAAARARRTRKDQCRVGPGGRQPCADAARYNRDPSRVGFQEPPRACAGATQQESCVKLQEHRSKEILARHGVPLLAGETATTPEEAAAAAERVGGPVVVKAQVLVGGRGKAGGVKLAATPAEAADRAGEIIGLDIKGTTVKTVLVAPAAEI